MCKWGQNWTKELAKEQRRSSPKQHTTLKGGEGFALLLKVLLQKFWLQLIPGSFKQSLPESTEIPEDARSLVSIARKLALARASVALLLPHSFIDIATVAMEEEGLSKQLCS